jgi:hypothetical protein
MAPKKPQKVMCGSCTEEFEESKIQMVTLPINPSSDKNGFYYRNLCGKCEKDPFYANRIVDRQAPRKLGK